MAPERGQAGEEAEHGDHEDQRRRRGRRARQQGAGPPAGGVERASLIAASLRRGRRVRRPSSRCSTGWPDAGDQVLVVGGDQHGGAQPVQLDEQPEDAQGHLVVDVAGRLVGQQDVGPADHGAGDGQPLLLAAGQGRRAWRACGAQADPGQQLGHVGAVVGRLAAGDAQRQGGVVEGRQVVEQAEVLEHHADAAAQEAAGRAAATWPDVLAEQVARGPATGWRPGRSASAASSCPPPTAPVRKWKEPGGSVEVDVPQHLRPAAIAHADAVEAEDRRQRRRIARAALAVSGHGGRNRRPRIEGAGASDSAVMILTCPECATRYFVDDDAGRPGRPHRACASCGARWTRHARSADRRRSVAPRRRRSPATPPTPSAPEPAALVSDLPGEALPKVFRAKAEDREAGCARRAATGVVWAGMAAVLAVLVAGAVVFRVERGAACGRGRAAAYAAVGLPVNPLGLVDRGACGPSRRCRTADAALSVSGVDPQHRATRR